MMQAGKRAAAHLRAIVKGVLFIGTNVQIALGIAWMCCNFGRIQDFQESGSAVYRGISRLFWGNAPVLHAVQLGAAFGAGCIFLRNLGKYLFAREYVCGKEEEICSLRKNETGQAGGCLWGERIFAVWGSLALLTFPFAMQCHLALLPCSFQASLFLLGLSFFLKLLILRGDDSRKKEGAFGRKKEKGKSGRKERETGKAGFGKAGSIVAGMACFCVMAVLYQGMEGSLVSEYGIEAAFASRVAWPTVWLDRGGWSEELREIAEDVSRQAGFNPENMEILCQRIEEAADKDIARDYYLQIAEHAWKMHSYMVVRQIGWDVLGYMFTPVIVPLQLEGEAYDSFTGRNYEVMGEHAPALTACYVKYGCWWFVCCIILSLCLEAAVLIEKDKRRYAGRCFKRCAAAVLVCGFASAVLTVLLTMRGAGLMDYKSATAVNELWLAGALLFGTARKT